MLRNLIKNKVQFFSIFIMSFLGLYVFVGMNSEVAGFTAAEDAFYTKYDLADIWVQGKNFTTDDLSHIREIKGIKEGDTVVLYGSDDLTMDEVASWLGTINYELPCMLSPRVPRVYKG